jgi:hypothetical protein
MMPSRRTFGCAFVAVLCSLFAAEAALAAKRPTVAGELKRLAREGAIAPEVAAAHRVTYNDARAKVRKFTGARKVQLGGVVKDLEDMARRDQFRPSRLPALFLTLQRNVEWWSTQRLLRPGERVSFSYDARTSALLDEALSLATERAGGLAWEYLFPFNGQAPPWVSSLAQGTGLQAMARSATRLGRQAEVFPVAMRGLGIFQERPPAGVRLKAGKGAHYLQYSGLPKLKILNGFIQSLVGLYDFAELTGDPTARSLFEAGDTAGRREVPTFDTGAWSLYSRGSIKRESDLGYHKLLRDFLVELCKRTAAEQYCGAHEHFTAYLTEPPTVEVLPRTLRPNRSGKLRFKLSKISRVSLRVTRGDTTVAIINPGVLGRGTKSLAWTAPKRTGDYELTVSATDLAGNAATAAGEVSIKKRP